MIKLNSILIPMIRFIAFVVFLFISNTSCADLSVGDYRFEIEFGGRARSYLAHIPNFPRPLPVVLSLHGGGGNAMQHRDSTGMNAAADRDGYIVVYPNGSGLLSERLLTWNAGNCCGYAQKQDIEDVGFIAALLDDLERRASVDTRRIYVAGHSNGGMMAHRLGEALSGRITAIASVAGAHIPVAAQGRTIPVLHIHSEDDPRALYNGGLGPPFPFVGTRVLHPAVNDMLAEWVKHDQCNSMPVEAGFISKGTQTARKLVYDNCRDGALVVLWKLTGAGHGWPGGKSVLEKLVGPSTEIIDANTEIWRFFSQFQLPR